MSFTRWLVGCASRFFFGHNSACWLLTAPERLLSLVISDLIAILSNYPRYLHPRWTMALPSPFSSTTPTAGFVPSWSGGFNDAAIARASNMDYELPQIQGACVNGPSHFANAARGLVVSFRAHGLDPRNVGFEISMDSFSFAANHVSADRAAECTRKAYGKGARAIYIYGNGHDHLPDYLRALAKMGVRTPR